MRVPGMRWACRRPPLAERTALNMFVRKTANVILCALLATVLGAAGWRAVQAGPQSQDRSAARHAPAGARRRRSTEAALPDPTASERGGEAFAFSQNGEILFAIDADHAVRRWQLLTGKELEPVALKAEEEARAISADGKFLALTFPRAKRAGTCRYPAPASA